MAHQSSKRGHLALKSNALNPTATSYDGQQLILNHMKSHYNRISSAKASVDTSAPRSIKKHIKVKDQKKRESMRDSDIQSEGNLTPRRRVQSTSLENLSNYGGPWTRSRPHSSQGHHRTISPPDHSTPEPGSIPRNITSTYHESSKDQPRHSRQETNEIQSRVTPYISPRALPGPLVSHSRWKTVDNRESMMLSSYDYDARNRRKPIMTPHMNNRLKKEKDFTQNLHSEFTDTTYYTERNDEGGESLYRGDGSTSTRVPALDSSYGSCRMSSPYARRKKDIQTKMWVDEQKYMLFISDVTSDVLARGIFSNRVLNKVFESHIDKRKEDLDERHMRDMIDQLKLDLDITAA